MQPEDEHTATETEDETVTTTEEGASNQEISEIESLPSDGNEDKDGEEEEEVPEGSKEIE